MERVKNDPGLRAELELATTLQISHKRLTGWVPKTITRTHNTGETIAVSEPEWDPEQVALMLAYQHYKNNKCPNCGNQVEDCLADDTREAQNVWVASFAECEPTRVLLEAQEYQRTIDPENTAVGHRLWAVTKQNQQS